MLDPNGHLARLHIDSIQEGMLVRSIVCHTWFALLILYCFSIYLTPSLSPTDLAYVRDSLAFNSFQGQYITMPPPASLKYLKLDILMDPYGLQIHNSVLQPHLEGGFALVHQLFQSMLGRGQFDLFITYEETYPLQTRVCSLEELDMRIGMQYYGDVSYLWPEMSHSLTVLMIRLCACFDFYILSSHLIADVCVLRRFSRASQRWIRVAYGSRSPQGTLHLEHICPILQHVCCHADGVDVGI